jgi:hypothetical protein
MKKNCKKCKHFEDTNFKCFHKNRSEFARFTYNGDEISCTNKPCYFDKTKKKLIDKFEPISKNVYKMKQINQKHEESIRKIKKSEKKRIEQLEKKEKERLSKIETKAKKLQYKQDKSQLVENVRNLDKRMFMLAERDAEKTKEINELRKIIKIIQQTVKQNDGKFAEMECKETESISKIEKICENCEFENLDSDKYPCNDCVDCCNNFNHFKPKQLNDKLKTIIIKNKNGIEFPLICKDCSSWNNLENECQKDNDNAHFREHAFLTNKNCYMTDCRSINNGYFSDHSCGCFDKSKKKLSKTIKNKNGIEFPLICESCVDWKNKEGCWEEDHPNLREHAVITNKVCGYRCLGLIEDRSCGCFDKKNYKSE